AAQMRVLTKRGQKGPPNPAKTRRRGGGAQRNARREDPPPLFLCRSLRNNRALPVERGGRTRDCDLNQFLPQKAVKGSLSQSHAAQLFSICYPGHTENAIL